jgi:hypothetical protein
VTSSTTTRLAPVPFTAPSRTHFSSVATEISGDGVVSVVNRQT